MTLAIITIIVFVAISILMEIGSMAIRSIIKIMNAIFLFTFLLFFVGLCYDADSTISTVKETLRFFMGLAHFLAK